MKIPFNQPFISGKEIDYIKDAVASGKISGNGKYTKMCQDFFESNYGFQKCLLTTSCTDALEMCAILANIQPGDEVILPSYTFVSTANAFVLRGAKLVFIDSRPDHPGMDEAAIEAAITKKTKAIVVVHYAGVACDMDKIMAVSDANDLIVIEDAAQSVDSFYQNQAKKPLGSIGHLSAFSFHETKNIISGEGGMLVINDERFIERSEIIWEKGTNRSAFFRGEVDKYGWVDVGSSFLPSEIVSAFLFAQLEKLEEIQGKRKLIWNTYYECIQNRSEYFKKPLIPEFATNNAHMFYLVTNKPESREKLIAALKAEDILSVFHYLSLHKSPFAKTQNWESKPLPLSDHYSGNLVRLPLYYNLEVEEAKRISSIINSLEL